ncbi:MAG: hypothetical protein ACRDIL_05100 [Candidatus Limnocylindrales bacterium]
MMLATVRSLGVIGEGVPSGGEFAVAFLFASTAVIAVSMIAVVLGDNLTQARVSSAAKSAALGAARQTSPDLATLAAQRAAVETLTDLERFSRPMVIVDVSRFRSAGVVEVTVACTVEPRPIGPIDRAVQIRQATASASAHPSLKRRH